MEKHEHNKAKDSITISKSTMWKASTAILAVLFVISLFTGGFGIGKKEVTRVITNPTAPSPSGPTAAVNAKDLVDDDPYLGNKNAPLVMVEFSDFQCPFCKRFRDQTLNQIKSQYIDTGKVKFVYRDFPLESIHPVARPSAEAAQCVYEQDKDKFWQYHDIIFERQELLSTENLKQWATEIGLNTGKFNDCFDSGKYRQEVSKDLNDATSSGGQGTPFFVIGNIPVSGAQPFAAFQQAIESQL